MSQHPQTHRANPPNANLVAFILIVNFVIIGGLILSYMSPLLPRDAAGVGIEVARVESTATLLPTSTPVSPTSTSTPLPTRTTVPSATPTEPPAPTATSTPQVVADTVSSGDGAASVDYDPALVAQGQNLFMLCSACHGPDARGLPNLGKDLVASEFVHSLSDEELMTFVKTGRPIWDPLNTTGIDMPPKGGNPAMTDEDILAIIAYIRSLSAGG